MATDPQQIIRNRIIRRLRRLQLDLARNIADKEWWNNNRLDAEPFDVGWDRMLLQYTSKTLACFLAGDTKGANHWNRRMMELAHPTELPPDS